MSTTTIQVTKPTKQLLNKLKKSFHSKNYDEVIKTLVRKKTKSQYGKHAKGKDISLEKIMKGLREKSDRF